MRFEKLRLSGFKSFVEPAELRVEPGLTGIVGPNGCGKSNLLEAIRWAMGEGSPKSLRGGGMEDVIFAGTATRPPRDFAEVSILVERDRDDDGAGGDESEVTRRIERGAGSAYRIDGRDARRKDAEQKLRATEANLARLAEILAEQDARAGALRRQARAAERYRQLSDKIRSVEARLVHARWAEADRSAESAN